MSANNNMPNGGNPPKYINDFSKALANEVRILLAEVGKLRDERRQLQYEIAELMNVKSKFGGGGEFQPDWHPKPAEPPPGTELAVAPPVPEAPVPAPPAWRVVHKRERKMRKTGAPAPPPAAGAAPVVEAPPPGPAWAQWRPNAFLDPGPLNAAVAATPPPVRTGLFGPPSPRSK
ncbi:hypothetical protein FISHEDRAFT_68471 [Fistulina hepatica ATCC 64428]|uniref:Uncharacterized protein n=1 Tax=Fistulina hepatica ATCC 64428 TaxID=1128425 RepID=A0A0D7AQ84_9AGAR|nr:hypothetical protein FISHEDRAFT_68471 [Fistulina hepatica ATCC 64428]